MSRSTLSYDGHGINGPDEYRTRIATFTNPALAKEYGPLFEAAPEMLEALRNILADCENAQSPADWDFACVQAVEYARSAIAKATKRS